MENIDSKTLISLAIKLKAATDKVLNSGVITHKGSWDYQDKYPKDTYLW